MRRRLELRRTSRWLRRADGAVGRITVKELQQLAEDGTRDGLGEQVGDHNAARDMAQRKDLTSHQIAKKLSSTQNVLRLLERNRVESHVNGRLRIGPNNTGGTENDAKVD